jgi:methionyl-tRNA synthetase
VLAKEARGEELAALMADLCEGLRVLAVMLHSFMPERAREMWRQLGLSGEIDAGTSVFGATVQPGDPLFPRIELVSA